MNNIKAENFLKKTIIWLICAALFTPLIISSSTLFPYVFGKAISFQVITELMLIAFVWLAYFNFRQTGKLNYLPRLNFFVWSLIILLGIMFLNMVLSVDPSYSFWSKQERMDGFFNLLHFFLFFFIIISVVKDKKTWFLILDVSLIASIIVCAHALGQKIGVFFAPYGERLTGPLGNASFLATYLSFNIFFAAILFLYRNNKKAKIYYAAVILFEIIVLFLTFTRGAIFSFGAGIILSAAMYALWNKKDKVRKLSFSLIIILVLSASILFSIKESSFIKNNQLLNRLTNISFQESTGKSRLISWKIGLNAFLEKPLFGWGQENYYVAFNKHMDPIFFTYSSETFDRAHNKIIDLLVMNGLFGLLAYLLVFGAASYSLFPYAKKGSGAAIILLSLLGAYFIQNFFIFDMPISYLMFFILLALIYFVAEGAKKSAPVSFPKKNTLIFQFITLFCSLLAIIALWSGNLKPVIASQESILTQKLFSAVDKSDITLKMAMASFKKSLGYGTFTNSETGKIIPYLAANIKTQNKYSQKAKIETLKETAQILEQFKQKQPLFFDNYLNLFSIYGDLSEYENSAMPANKQTAKELLSLYPNVPYFYYKPIVNSVLSGDSAFALELAQKAAALNPQLAQSQWHLALAYFYAGNSHAAKEATEKAISQKFDYSNSANNLYFLAKLHATLKEYDKATTFYKDAIERAPNELQLYAELVKTYQEAGQKEKAIELTQKLLASSTPQTAPVIQELLDSLK